MAQQIINNGESGLVVRTKLNENYTELYGGVTNIVEVSTNYTALVTDDIILATGPLTVDLITFSSFIKPLTIKSVIGGGDVTVDAFGAETIEGATTQVLTTGQGLTLAPSSTQLEIIA